MGLKRTVVGSLPRLHDSLGEAIKLALQLQLSHGIDIPSDGEQRCNMIDYFEQIPGLGKGEKGLRIVGRIRPMKEPREAFKIRDYRFARRYLNEVGKGDVEIKTALTGPITLALACATHEIGYYEGPSDEQIYLDFAETLKPLVNELLDMGSLVQIDEPMLPLGSVKPRDAVDVINVVLKDVPQKAISEGRVSLHACGDLTKVHHLVDEMLKLKVGIMSFEFGGKEENMDLLTKEGLVKGDKRVGAGCVSTLPSATQGVDGVERILRRLEKLRDKIGLDRIAYVHPDCGLRNTPYDNAVKILENLKKATDLFSTLA